MKNAASYEKKIRKLLKDMKKVRPDDPPTGCQTVAALVESILQADATDKQAQAAMEAIQKEYVDLNELRVGLTKDIVDCIGRDYPSARPKAEMISVVLNGIFQRTHDIKLDYMADMPKRGLRRHLSELGLSPYAAACVVMKVFGGHAVPVDDTLVEVLQMGRYVHPASDLGDVQGFLTRVTAQKNDLSAHEFFRAHVKKSARALARKRKAEAEARAKAEAAQKAKAEAEAKKQAKAEQAARRKAAAKKARKKAAKRPAAKKATRKSSSKAGKAPKKVAAKREFQEESRR